MFYVYHHWVRYTAEQVAQGRTQVHRHLLFTRCRRKIHAIESARSAPWRTTVTRGQTSEIVFDNGRQPAVDPQLPFGG
jgi:hypothetical protein